MSELAEIVKAPSGTQYRTGSDQSWLAASVGTKLFEGSEARNTQSNDYETRLFDLAELRLAAAATLELKDVSGTVKYQDSNGTWNNVTSDGTYTAKAVGTGAIGGVIVVCGEPTGSRVPPWD